MVWQFDYRPRADRNPDAKVLEGNLKRPGRRGGEHLVLEDYSADGGGGLQVGLFEDRSGRRVRSESIPKVIQWNSSNPPMDYEIAICRTVSQRFRDVIEKLEPGVHQFQRIEFVAKDGRTLSYRWFWQICNRLDAMDRDRTDMVFSNLVWLPNPSKSPHDEVGVFIDIAKIGSAVFWFDKHLSGGPFCNDHAKKIADEIELSGLHFRPINSA